MYSKRAYKQFISIYYINMYACMYEYVYVVFLFCCILQCVASCFNDAEKLRIEIAFAFNIFRAVITDIFTHTQTYIYIYACIYLYFYNTIKLSSRCLVVYKIYNSTKYVLGKVFFFFQM